MATMVSLTQNSLTQLNWRTLKTPYLLQEYWWYLLYKLSYGLFCVQMTSACCHGNKGGS